MWSSSRVTDACIFCEIVAGRAEASIAYEDDTTLAFMDLRQFHAGHTLVVPKRHIVDIYELDDAVGAGLMSSVARISRGVRDAFAPDGLNIWQSNGEAGGQEVFHLHFHVLPRWHDDELLRFYPRKPDYPARTVLDERAAMIRIALEGGS